MAIPKLIVLETFRSLGRPGLAGVLLIFAALVYGMAWVLPARDEVMRIEERLGRAETRLAQALSGNGTEPRAVAAGQEDFYQALPARAEVVSWVEHIYDTAAKEQLALVRGEYVQAPVADTRLVRYQIFLPMKGDYDQSRRFLATSLASVPGLGLEDLRLKRESAAESQVEALVRFSLYLAKP